MKSCFILTIDKTFDLQDCSCDHIIAPPGVEVNAARGLMHRNGIPFSIFNLKLFSIFRKSSEIHLTGGAIAPLPEILKVFSAWMKILPRKKPACKLSTEQGMIDLDDDMNLFMGHRVFFPAVFLFFASAAIFASAAFFFNFQLAFILLVFSGILVSAIELATKKRDGAKLFIRFLKAGKKQGKSGKFPVPLYSSDWELGWKMRGNLDLKIRLDDCCDKDAPEWKLTTDSQGNRMIPDGNGSARKIYTMGCSFTYGFGVDDPKTYPAVLQRLLGKEFQVINLSGCAYSTYQNLLKLEKLLEGDSQPELIIYGFHSNILERSIFNLERAQVHKGFKMPSCVSKKGRLIRRKPHPYWIFPLSGRSVLFSKAELHYNRFFSGPQDDSTKMTTEMHLLLLMNQRCAKKRIRFFVYELSCSNRLTGEWRGEMMKSGLLWSSSGLDIEKIPERWNLLPYDRHPNSGAHEHWAKQLNGLIREDFKNLCHPTEQSSTSNENISPFAYTLF
ncbi:MAG: hypothetical protein A2017_07515 [Lentisphaerae bacterium GWF2_44_16]|nr:MAG: hypothetical protein A2017_07515 [Lentisphaerae bacterium GWF2_44_16]